MCVLCTGSLWHLSHPSLVEMTATPYKCIFQENVLRLLAAFVPGDTLRWCDVFSCGEHSKSKMLGSLFCKSFSVCHLAPYTQYQAWWFRWYHQVNCTFVHLIPEVCVHLKLKELGMRLGPIPDCAQTIPRCLKLEFSSNIITSIGDNYKAKCDTYHIDLQMWFELRPLCSKLFITAVCRFHRCLVMFNIICLTVSYLIVVCVGSMCVKILFTNLSLKLLCLIFHPPSLYSGFTRHLWSGAWRTWSLRTSVSGPLRSSLRRLKVTHIRRPPLKPLCTMVIWQVSWEQLFVHLSMWYINGRRGLLKVLLISHPRFTMTQSSPVVMRQIVVIVLLLVTYYASRYSSINLIVGGQERNSMALWPK